MPGQGTIRKVIGVGAGLESLVVPAAGKRPISLELCATRVGGEGNFDFRPSHIPMLVDVPIGDGVGNSLVANRMDQPIKDHRGLMVGDGIDEASGDCVTLNFIDPSTLTGNPADLVDNRPGVPHSLPRTGTGELGWHVRSTQLTGVERRCHRRCSPGWSESIGDRREFEHPATTHRRCGPAPRHDIVSQQIVEHEREDERAVYPRVSKFLADHHGLGAMSQRIARSSIRLGFYDGSLMASWLRMQTII